MPLQRLFVIPNLRTVRYYQCRVVIPSLPQSTRKTTSLFYPLLRGPPSHPLSASAFYLQTLCSALPPPSRDRLQLKGKILPICPGCGASSQTEDPAFPGFYDLKAARRKELDPRVNIKKARYREEGVWAANLARYEAVLAGLRGNSKKGSEKPEQNEMQKATGDEGVVGKQDETRELCGGHGNAQVQEGEEDVGESLQGSRTSVAGKQQEGTTVTTAKESPDRKLAMMEANHPPNEETTKDPILPPEPFPQSTSDMRFPLCERCHSLLHQNTGSPLPAYPDLDTLVELIVKSNHERNHIFHLVDAADFPLSLIPRLRSYLTQYLPRSKAKNLSVSYIVTRADLLMPKEYQITSMMTYLKTVLKGALPEGEPVENHRSQYGGHFRVLSVRAGWSVGRVKEEFTDRLHQLYSRVESSEGGIWVVGKVNVGKSRFVREIVPEGSFTDLERVVETVSGRRASYQSEIRDTGGEYMAQAVKKQDVRALTMDQDLDQQHLLPPVMPTVSDMPGTTVAPVRVIIGRKGCEIIDLPGMDRGHFLEYVRPDVRRKVQMQKRVDPEQYVVKDGQSLLLAGLIMIEPITRGTDVLMYPFTALPVHVTSTESALKLMNHPSPESSICPILFQYKPDPGMFTQPKEINDPGAVVDREIRSQVDEAASISWRDDRVPALLPSHIKPAGTFRLSHDVTRLRNPQLSEMTAAEIELLPYKVYSTDILLEGIGWVEVIAQIRSKQAVGGAIPEVKVFTPLGKGAGTRLPMGADMMRLEGMKDMGLFGIRRPRKLGKPRAPMKGKKKEMKRRKRES